MDCQEVIKRTKVGPKTTQVTHDDLQFQLTQTIKVAHEDLPSKQPKNKMFPLKLRSLLSTLPKLPKYKNASFQNFFDQNFCALELK